MMKVENSLSEQEIEYIYRKYKPPINLEDFVGNPQFKDFLCYHWVRGLCQEGNLCRYAHGVDELVYHKGSPNVKRPRFPYIHYEKWERNFISLFEYQKGLHQQGLIKEIIPLEILNKARAKRLEIREHFHIELTKELINKILDVFHDVFFTRAFVEREIQRLGLKSRFVSSLYGKVYYERKIPVPPRLTTKYLAIRKMPTHEQMKNIICNKLVKLTNELMESGEKLPIMSDTIFKYYYSLEDFNEPTLKFFLKTYNISFDSILESIENNNEWRSKIQAPLTESPDEKVAIFRTNKIELETRSIQLKDICDNLFAAKNTKHPSTISILIKWRDFEEKALVLLPNLKKFLNNDKTLFRTFIQKCLIVGSYYPFFFQAQHFVFDLSIDRLMKTFKGFQSKKSKCPFLKNEHSEQKYSCLLENEESVNKIATDLKTERITVIDNRERFEATAGFIKNFKYLGIDLEGPIFYGKVDLIAISVSFNKSDKEISERDTKIFIIDIFAIEKSEDSALKIDIRAFLKEILEDPNRIKVFHDSRKDSFALHFHLDICPQGVYDVSALHCLCEQLEIYLGKSWKDGLELDNAFLLPFKMNKLYNPEDTGNASAKNPLNEVMNQEEKQALRIQKKAEKLKKSKKKEPTNAPSQDQNDLDTQKSEIKEAKEPFTKKIYKHIIPKPVPPSKKKDESNSSHQVYQIKNPGLNEVLSAYGAKNGINELKASMKKMFLEKEREFFLRRPLDQDFLEYTAKDVEDLIEVHFKIKARILDQLMRICSSNSKNTDSVRILCEEMIRKISQSYVKCGCVEASKMV